MSQHTAHVIWTRTTHELDLKTYSRDHTITFASGAVIAGSAANGPHLPAGTIGANTVDPEVAVVGALSACHMLFFLALAAKRGHGIERYEDAAVGLLEARDGATWLTKITLHPRVTWVNPAPAQDVIDTLHHDAHKRCYIANSLKGEVAIEPVA